MAARVTVEDLKKILPTEAKDDDVSIFITNANLLVDEELLSQGVSESRLKLIELYLAAHFWIITSEKGGLTRQKIGDSEDFFQAWTNTEKGLQATRYGQQASMMDTTGKLAALATGRLRAQFRVVGNNPADETY